MLAEYCNTEGEAARCLECSTICENCADVCPNRANVALSVCGRIQILHIHSRCNECGNCEAFCPYESAPYKAKFTLYPTVDELRACDNDGFAIVDAKKAMCEVKLGGKIESCNINGNKCALPEDIHGLIRAYFEVYGG